MLALTLASVNEIEYISVVAVGRVFLSDTAVALTVHVWTTCSEQLSLGLWLNEWVQVEPSAQLPLLCMDNALRTWEKEGYFSRFFARQALLMGGMSRHPYPTSLPCLPLN